MISVNRIKYNNCSSTDFDLLCDLAFDSDNGASDSFLTREAVASESYRGLFKRVHNYKYTETFSPQFTFIKKGFGDFTIEEQRKVLKWLTSTSNASFLTVYYDDSEVISWEALGGFTEITPYKLANGRTVGIVATFEATTPYALSPLKTITKDMSNPNDNTITLNINTDEPQSFIYPRITIKQNDTVININRALTNSDKLIDNTVYCYEDDEGIEHYYYKREWYGVAKATLDDDGGGEYIIIRNTSVDYNTEEEAKNGAKELEEEVIKEIIAALYSNLGYSAATIKTYQTALWADYKANNITYGYKKYNGDYDANLTYYISLGGYDFRELTGESQFNQYSNQVYTRFKITFDFDPTASKGFCDSIKNPNIETTSVVITNTYQNEPMITKNNIKGETIILDGANRIVSSSRTTNRIFGDDFTWNWLPLAEGENIISVTGNCTITIEWREPIKCGA